MGPLPNILGVKATNTVRMIDNVHIMYNLSLPHPLHSVTSLSSERWRMDERRTIPITGATRI